MELHVSLELTPVIGRRHINMLMPLGHTVNLLTYRSVRNPSLWATEPNRVVKFKKKTFFLFFAKKQCKYIGIGDIWQEQVGTSHFRPSTGPKTAKNGHFGQF